jgi:sarcosine oxidase subunit alpha
MSGQFRLPATAPQGFAGTLIDRSRSLRFRLNGREISGFAGDTVLSAALACGVDVLGRLGPALIGLDTAASPAVQPQGADRPAALPMDRLPAIDGADLVTLAPRRDRFPLAGVGGWVRRKALGDRHVLNLSLGDAPASSTPWLDGAVAETRAADLIIVGAGVAGLAAAGLAVGLGKRVIIVEAAPEPGGALPYFGAVESEAGPREQIAELVAALNPARPPKDAPKGSAELLHGTEAFRVFPGRVLAHQVHLLDGKPQGRVLALEAPHIVLATGSVERLPVFAGNRLPGIFGSLDGFTLARRYGVWPGRRTLVATPHSHAYRLALYLHDAGVAVSRIIDSRLAPQSRFIDFCKATGVTFSSGLLPQDVQPVMTRDSYQLSVGFAGVAAAPAAAAKFDTDILVAAGSFQPQLGLWLAAGGRIGWSAESQMLVPHGTLDGIAVAGSAAGWRSTRAAIRSGEAAVLTQLGRAAPPIDDPVIPAMYETPDGPNPIAPRVISGRQPAFLDRGPSYLTRALGEAGSNTADRRTGLMTLGAVVAAVELGAFTPLAAADIARERTALGADLVDEGWMPPALAAQGDTPPAWLAGRFGDRPVKARLSSTDGRVFEPGALLFARSDVADARQAIGAVFASTAPGETGGFAVLADPPPPLEALLFVREGGGLYTARVVSSEPASFS